MQLRAADARRLEVPASQCPEVVQAPRKARPPRRQSGKRHLHRQAGRQLDPRALLKQKVGKRPAAYHHRYDEKRIREHGEPGDGCLASDERKDGRCLRGQDVRPETSQFDGDAQTDERRPRRQHGQRRGIASLQRVLYGLVPQLGRCVLQLFADALDQRIPGCVVEQALLSRFRQHAGRLSANHLAKVCGRLGREELPDPRSNAIESPGPPFFTLVLRLQDRVAQFVGGALGDLGGAQIRRSRSQRSRGLEPERVAGLVPKLHAQHRIRTLGLEHGVRRLFKALLERRIRLGALRLPTAGGQVTDPTRDHVEQGRAFEHGN